LTNWLNLNFMQGLELFFNNVLIWPILNLLMFFYKIFELVKIPGAFGLAIIALTALVRTITLPLTSAQLKSAQKMQALKPKIDALSAKFKNDKVKLQQAQLELYKEAGVNPAAGCLPALVQLPVFIALYNVFIHALNVGGGIGAIADVNKVLYHPFLHAQKIDLWFFGVNLATKPSEWQKLGLGLLLVPLITGGLQYLQTKLMTSAQPKAIEKLEKIKEKAEPDQMASMQKQMGLIMPVMIGFFAYSFPLGLALYWNIFTLFGIMQQLQINKQAYGKR